ncbi:MAG: 8-amino-7-oxononanoate synthase [Candidatus Marinimicrobia bacterium]|nr:8-amino-7-oxononanoate synthase [Candidatus Neomarinimicrobiota bacterium]
MKYIKNLYQEAKRRDLYPDIPIVNDIAYPELTLAPDKKFLCFCSNNYLGLSIHPKVKQAAIEAVKTYGIGTCESRLVAGNLHVLEDLERAISDFKNTEDALVFLSGFMANIGAIPAIMDSYRAYDLPSINNKNNLIIKDILAHTSIIDGCKLSQSNTKSYLHNDMNHLEKILRRNKDKRKLIITDGVFSMDGDMAPLDKIVELAKKYNAMTMVDDAHATGVIGENGRGTPEYFGVEDEIDIVMGTLSKATGGLGGFITGPREVIEMLKVRSHSYVFTSTLPPEQAAAMQTALRIIKEQPELRINLHKNVEHLRSGLKKMGYNILNSETQIIPIFIGDNKKSIKLSRQLYKNGILASAIRYPAVSSDQSRIRLSVMATHTEAQIEKGLNILEKCGKEVGII